MPCSPLPIFSKTGYLQESFPSSSSLTAILSLTELFAYTTEPISIYALASFVVTGPSLSLTRLRAPGSRNCLCLIHSHGPGS